MGLFTFHVVGSEAELSCVRALRAAVYRQRLGVALSENLAEGERDALGYVFLLRFNGEPVGTARVVPTACGRTELGQLHALPAWAALDPHCVEVGRIATLRCLGVNSMTTSNILISACARWVLGETSLLRYVAYNRLVLLPVWRRLGAIDTGERFVIAERGGAEYALITGELRDVVARTAGDGDVAHDQMVSVA
jgi:hypothetical protein